MKFIIYLNSILGTDVYPMIGLFIFTLFLSGVLVWIFGMDKNKMKRLEEKVRQLEENPTQDGTGSIDY